MINKSMKTLLLAIVLAAASGARAQQILTLDRAVDLALRQNNILRAASSDLEASEWGKKQSYTNFLPRVELSGSYTRIDPETEARANAAIDFIRAASGSLGLPASILANLRPFAYRETWATDITVIQPVYNGGMELVGVQAAGARQDQSTETYRESEQALIAGVRMGYYTVLRNQALVALANESAARTRRWLAMMERRAELGERTPTDVLRFRVQLAQEEGNIILADNQLAASRRRLNELLGEPLEAAYELQDVASTGPDSADGALSAPAPVPPATADTLFAEHPAVKAMEANVRLAQAGISQAWTRFQPRINLAFQYGWEKNNTAALDGIRPWALALTLNWPIFNSFGDYANLRRSEAEAKRAEEQMESFRRQIRIQASDAGQDLTAAFKRVEIATVAYRESRKVLESVERRYELGSASNVDLIDAQTAHTRGKTDYITAVYDTYLAAARLEQARGMVTR